MTMIGLPGIKEMILAICESLEESIGERVTYIALSYGERMRVHLCEVDSNNSEVAY